MNPAWMKWSYLAYQLSMLSLILQVHKFEMDPVCEFFVVLTNWNEKNLEELLLKCEKILESWERLLYLLKHSFILRQKGYRFLKVISTQLNNYLK